MRYYFLRLLSLLKVFLGYLTTKIAALYNTLGRKITDGITKEITRINDKRDNHIKQANQAVVDAALRVVELESSAKQAEVNQCELASKKIYKLTTKVK
jgi:hypothetical protein